MAASGARQLEWHPGAPAKLSLNRADADVRSSRWLRIFMAYGEKLLTDDWRIGAKNGAMVEIEGYLVQVPTLPESSGSPVYVRRSLAQKTLADIASGHRDRASDRVRAWMHGSVWLLGIWHGTWKTEEKNVIVGTNMGACIPAPRILETLERPELKVIRLAPRTK